MGGARAEEHRAIVFAVGTSTYDTGLLDDLVPPFEKENGTSVKVIPVGSGQALALAARGEADLVLSHAPEAEQDYMARGLGTARLRMMRNQFILVGPPEDPAGISGARSAREALSAISRSGAGFVSRGDDSGTHMLERKLWQQTSTGPPAGPSYMETGQGQGATLRIASEKQAYALTESGTYHALARVLQLAILYRGGVEWRNVYHLIIVNPANGSRVNAEGALRLARYLLSPATQERVRKYGLERFGQALFVPDSEPLSSAGPGQRDTDTPMTR